MFKAVFLFVFLLSSPGQAEEASQSVIEQSTRALVKKERARAISILSSALLNTKMKASEKKQLVTAVKRASVLFVSDRGQSLFESGRNLYLVNPSEALSKMDAALAIEGENAQVLWAKVKIHFRLSNCEKAKETFEMINPWSQESHFNFLPLYHYCTSKSPAEFEKEGLSPFEKVFFSGVFAYMRGDKKKAFAELEKALGLDREFIETYYWLWKIDEEEYEMALKYRKACDSEKLKLLKKYDEFPQLCQFADQISIEQRKEKD